MQRIIYEAVVPVLRADPCALSAWDAALVRAVLQVLLSLLCLCGSAYACAFTGLACAAVRLALAVPLARVLVLEGAALTRCIPVAAPHTRTLLSTHALRGHALVWLRAVHTGSAEGHAPHALRMLARMGTHPAPAPAAVHDSRCTLPAHTQHTACSLALHGGMLPAGGQGDTGERDTHAASSAPRAVHWLLHAHTRDDEGHYEHT